jgi:predicted porin
MKLRKSQLAAAVGAALLAGAVQAQNVTPGQTGQAVQLYGHVNRAMMFADNDLNSKWFFVDGQPSSTRFGIFAEADIQPGLRGGARIETEIRSNQSNAVTFAAPSTASQSFTERFLEVFVRGGWGQINLGQGSGASDTTMEVDFAGVDLALSNPMNDFGGAIPFTVSVGSTTTASAVTPDTVMNNLDGFSRLDRVMYSTPTFNGFRAQVSYGNTTGSGNAIAAGEAFEAGIFWTGKVAGDLGFAFGYAKSSPNTAGLEATEHMGGSVSWLHTSGFSIGAAWGERDLSTVTLAPTTARSATHMNFQLGYKWGQHALGVKYEVTEDLAAIGDEATGIGIGYVWNPIRWAEFYASYMIQSLDRTPPVGASTNFNDITVAAVGTRIRF